MFPSFHDSHYNHKYKVNKIYSIVLHFKNLKLNLSLKNSLIKS